MFKLTWEDTFEKDGRPDETLWNIEVAGNGFGNNEDQYYTDRLENVYIKDNELHIIGLKEDFEHRHYTSAKLTTQNKKHIQYGRVEVMAQLPKGMGTWPAIWFLGENCKTVGWPACGEIDLMEHVGKNAEHIHFSLHTKTNSHIIGNQPTGAFKVDGILEGYHEFAMDWTEEYFIFYIDKKEMVRFYKKDYPNAQWPFDQPFYLILNLAIGGNWGGKIDDSIFPLDFKFKYVKVYERID